MTYSAPNYNYLVIFVFVSCSFKLHFILILSIFVISIVFISITFFVIDKPDAPIQNACNLVTYICKQNKKMCNPA